MLSYCARRRRKGRGTMGIQEPRAPVVVAAIERLRDDVARAAGRIRGLVSTAGSRAGATGGEERRERGGPLEGRLGPELRAIAPALRARSGDPADPCPCAARCAAPRWVPTKFLDIRRSTWSSGRRPFTGLDVPARRAPARRDGAPEHGLRLRAARARARDPAALSDDSRGRAPFAIELETLLRLAGKPLPRGTGRAIFERAAAAFDLRPTSSALAALRADAEDEADRGPYDGTSRP